MSRIGKTWLVWIVGIALVACTDPTQPSTALQLAFAVQPSNATAGVAIDPVITVAIQHESGDLAPDATNFVTLAIATNAGGGTMTGTLSVPAVNGIATFTNLRIDKAGAGYTLKARQAGPSVRRAISSRSRPVAPRDSRSRYNRARRRENPRSRRRFRSPPRTPSATSRRGSRTAWLWRSTATGHRGLSQEPLSWRPSEASRPSVISRSPRRAPRTPSLQAPAASPVLAASPLRSHRRRGRCTSRLRPRVLLSPPDTACALILTTMAMATPAPRPRRSV